MPYPVSALKIDTFWEKNMCDKVKTLDLSREELKKRAERMRKEKWASLEVAIPEKYRESVIGELKKIYSLFDYEASARWLAGLYDPETGGFYSAMSARAHEGFGPDIEATYLVLSAVGTMGMAELFDGDWAKANPSDVMQKAGEWIRSLQDERDGFFYNPQWPKEYVEKVGFLLRVTRDHGTAKTMLSRTGLKPKYEMHTGNKDGAPKGNSSMLAQYESDEAFREYIKGLEEELSGVDDKERAWKFYLWGSYFQSSIGLMSEGMKDMLVEFVDKYQNPENGVWNEKIDHNATNAIHKICSVYTRIGREMRYADKMIETTLKVLSFDAKTHPAGNICELYNIWSCLLYIYENIRVAGHGTKEEKEERITEMKNLVFSQVAEPIRATYEQMLNYYIGDGSFSTYVGRSHPGTCHCYTAVPGTKEGDIAGFLHATSAMPHYILAGLELLDFEIPFFTEYERLIYIDELRAAKPAVKKPNPNPR